MVARLDEMFKTIASFLIGFGGWGIVAILLIQILFFGDKVFTTVEKFWSISKHVSAFTFKRYTSTKLSNQILYAARAVSNISDDILPYQVKIKWVKNEGIESFLKSGQVIVKIRDDDDINKSFVLGIMEFIKQGLIQNPKRHLKDEKLIKAINLCVVDKILSSTYIESLSYFEKNILNDLLSTDAEFASYFESFKRLDCNGLFLPVFLNEISKALRCLDSQYFIEDYEAEVKAFLQYLTTFCTDKHKRLHYTSKYINISFGLIANRSFIFRYGKDAYVEKVRNSFTQGSQTVYLIGWGEKIKMIKQIANRTARTDIRVKTLQIHTYRHVFDDKSVIPAVCAELSVIGSGADACE